MKQPAPFDRLCDAYAIATAYEDIWGELHLVSKKVRRALLQAMGVDTHDEAAVLEALRGHEQAQWETVLPPVQVVSISDEPLRIPLQLPQALLEDQPGHLNNRNLSWTLKLEGGRQHSDHFSPAALPVLERHHIDGRTWLRYSLELRVNLPPGYHQVIVQAEDRELARMQLIIAPHQCYQPAALANSGRLWGPAVQLYALRSEHNWGIGDFTDLRHLVDFAADNGAGIVGVSPLHALFPDSPEHASPYSPSSRQFLNTLFIDIEAIADFSECSRLVRNAMDKVN